MGVGERAAALRCFLERHASGQAATAVMAKLYPFFDRAERGAYDLDDVDDARVLRCIARVAGTPANRIIRVHASELSRMNHGRRSAFLARQGANLRHGLWIRVLFRWNERLDPERKAALERELWRTLLGGLRTAFDARFVDALGRDQALQCWNDLAEPIAHFAAFACEGDEEGAQTMGDVVDLLPYAIPMCEHDRERGAWLMLVE